MLVLIGLVIGGIYLFNYQKNKYLNRGVIMGLGETANIITTQGALPIINQTNEIQWVTIQQVCQGVPV